MAGILRRCSTSDGGWLATCYDYVHSMRLESMVAWRSRAKVAIVIGFLGGVVAGAYPLFQLAANGLASAGCNGGGCEARLQEDAAHYQSLLLIAIGGGGGLVLAGVVAVIVFGKRLEQLRRVVLPVASVRETRPSDHA